MALQISASGFLNREYLPLTWTEKEYFNKSSIPVTEYHVDGTLPSFAFVFPINREKNRRGYKLLWYTGKKQHQENFIGPIDR